MLLYFFLEKLFGNEIMRTFREKHLFDYLELEREFEMVKRKVKIDAMAILAFQSASCISTDS